MTDPKPTAETTDDDLDWTDDADWNPDEDNDPEDAQTDVETMAPEAPKPTRKAKPKPAEPSLGDLAVDALKAEWANAARERFPLADVNQMGLTGVDTAAKERFFKDAERMHAEREAELVKLGYQRAEIPDAAQDAEDARRAAEWGQPVSGGTDAANSDQQLVSELNEAIGQGTHSVIETLIGKAGLADFALRRGSRG